MQFTSSAGILRNRDLDGRDGLCGLYGRCFSGEPEPGLWGHVDGVAVGESGFAGPLGYFVEGVGVAIGCVDEHVEGEHEAEWGAGAVVVDEEVFDDEHAAGGHAVVDLFDEVCVGGVSEGMDDVGQEHEVVSVSDVGEGHVSGAVFDAVLESGGGDFFACDFDDAGVIEEGGFHLGMGLEEGDGVGAGSCAEVEQVAVVGHVDDAEEFAGAEGGDVFHAEYEGA